MDTWTVTLTDFLLARIADDEAAAERGGPHNGGGTFANDNYGCLLIQPDRVLADCEAKRRQIQHLIDFMEGDYAPWNETQLQIMAEVYADHPDYDEAWRP